LVAVLHLVVDQIDPERNDVLASLEVHTDGALVYGLALCQDRQVGYSMIWMNVVNEDQVQRVLRAFVAFAHRYHRSRRSPLLRAVP